MSMPDNVRARCFDLRKRSKRGEFIGPDDFKFLESCFQRWPDEYKGMQRAVFVETAPTGSRLPQETTAALPCPVEGCGETLRPYAGCPVHDVPSEAVSAKGTAV